MKALLKRGCREVTGWGGGGGGFERGALPFIAYTRRLCQKVVPFVGLNYFIGYIDNNRNNYSAKQVALLLYVVVKN